MFVFLCASFGSFVFGVFCLWVLVMGLWFYGFSGFCLLKFLDIWVWFYILDFWISGFLGFRLLGSWFCDHLILFRYI